MNNTAELIIEFQSRNKDTFTLEEVVNVIQSFYNKEESPIIESCGYMANPATWEIYFEGKSVRLPRKEFMIVYLLISNRNKILSRHHILNKVWGYSDWIGDRTIDVHICKIKRKLNAQNIETIKGGGYTWKDK
jgi:two-component system alkaline phosphatase synthesis response regulator PhoP